ncbi:MAG: kynureninase [Thermoanaerobaculia bacterium]|nr:kynureninase [Thermoanaerobaculia bacterium]
MPGPRLADLRRSPNALARHYLSFRVSERLLLSGHSHQAWPDVAREGVLAAFDDAARAVDEKWELALAQAERVREGFRALLDDPGGEIALGASTHELIVRWLSALPLAAKPRLVTTDGEFHTLRRQMARLSEAGLEVVRVAAAPVETLAERLAGEIDERTAAVLTSAVFFETARIVPHLDELAAACEQRGTPLLVDAYHALGAIPFSLRGLGLESALVTGGGYKYLQLGEGNCFLRLPRGLELRPVVTGWFAEFWTKSGTKDQDRVEYGGGAAALAGSTYDPTSHYRAARVFDFFAEQGLTPAFLREVSQHQVGLLARCFDALELPSTLIRRDSSTPLDGLAGFLALDSPVAQALSEKLLVKGVLSDARGRSLRLGPAPYLGDDQLVRTIDLLGETARELT